MTTIYTRSQLENVIRAAEVIPAIEEGFVGYSNGKAVIPPVGQLLFENPPGDCHIKYGNITGDSTFTIKIATGFSRNADKGLPTSNGVILVFSSETPKDGVWDSAFPRPLCRKFPNCCPTPSG